MHRERRIIAALRARGAFVSVRPIPTAWPTLERLFGITDTGIAYLDELVPSDDSACAVDMHCTSITDAGLRLLRGAKGELYLHVGGTAVTQGGAAELTRRLPQYSVCLGCNDCLEAAEAGRTPIKEL